LKLNRFLKVLTVKMPQHLWWGILLNCGAQRVACFKVVVVPESPLKKRRFNLFKSVSNDF